MERNQAIKTTPVTQARVAAIGHFGETYEDVVNRLIDFFDEHSQCRHRGRKASSAQQDPTKE